MHDSATAGIRQTVFGKDFGGIAQGNIKTSQKCTNAMFVMTHEEITYANPVVDHRPQKEDTTQIWITTRGDLIN
jgi:hypothetical protein